MMLDRLVLSVAGLIFVAIGLNIALGGFETLGWQFPRPGVTADDPLLFARHDNNARFLGGFFGGLGLIHLLAAFRPGLRSSSAVILLCLPLGGLARLMQPDYMVLTDVAFALSLLAEFVLGPAVGVWLLRRQKAL